MLQVHVDDQWAKKVIINMNKYSELVVGLVQVEVPSLFRLSTHTYTSEHTQIKRSIGYSSDIAKQGLQQESKEKARMKDRMNERKIESIIKERSCGLPPMHKGKQSWTKSSRRASSKVEKSLFVGSLDSNEQE